MELSCLVRPKCIKTSLHLPTSRRQRSQAIQLIAKHAGAYAAEAQKTKWVVDLVMKAVAESKDHIASQDAEIASLSARLEEQRSASAAAAAAAAQRAAALSQRVQELEAGLYNTGFALHTAQREHHEMARALAAARGTARAATAECGQLAAAVRRAGEQVRA
jgi:hypothetical protein